MAVPRDILTVASYFDKLEPATAARLAREALRVVHHAGETLYQQGDPPTGLFLLQGGRVKLYRQSGDRVQILALPIAGDCFGAETLADDLPSPFTATALTSTTCIYIPPQPLRALAGECPDLQEALLEVISARLRQFVSLVHDLAFRDVTARVATMLVSRARIEGECTEHGIRIARLLSQQEYAALVGTAREVIYRTFRKLEQERLISLTADTITILDLPRLAEVASQETR